MPKLIYYNHKIQYTENKKYIQNKLKKNKIFDNSEISENPYMDKFDECKERMGTNTRIGWIQGEERIGTNIRIWWIKG